MADKGYLYWDARFLRDTPFFDGRTLTKQIQEGGLKWDAADNLFLIPTAAGTHVLQKNYHSANRPALLEAFEFQISRLAIGEEDWFRFQRARARGAAVYWVPFLWIEEVINATAGQAYTLGRPVAWGIATGCTSGTHPAKFFLADVEDPTCASLTGQVLTAVDTGVITVRYVPAFRVVTKVSSSFAAVNALEDQITLSEVLTTS